MDSNTELNADLEYILFLYLILCLQCEKTVTDRHLIKTHGGFIPMKFGEGLLKRIWLCPTTISNSCNYIFDKRTEYQIKWLVLCN